ncbi:hypothetical protein B0H19DRAFT_84376 [Mycena capillaripes]|nr:hypothetical protein B0H19DRAFT_84376 [Mycena capillaripes]
MRPLDFTNPRLICTLAPPSITSHSLSRPPPVLIAKNRTKIDGSFLLLSSSSPDPDGPRKTWLGPARQLTHYALAESRHKTEISPDITKAMRRFCEPERPTNIIELGAFGKPYFSREPHLSEMLTACLRTPEGTRGLFEADVVAERETIKKLMFPHRAVFNASFAHGVLFLEDGREKLTLDTREVHSQIGFFRACTKMYRSGWREPKGHIRHTLHSVVARPLGGLNLLISGDVDCIKFKYTGDPACYMQLVTRPMRDGRYIIRPKTWKEWYFRAHLMGIRSLYLGLVDEGGVLRHTRRLATNSLPTAVAKGDGNAPWDPEEDMRWAARVLVALRDYCQEAADLAAVVSKHGLRAGPHIPSGDQPDRQRGARPSARTQQE